MNKNKLNFNSALINCVVFIFVITFFFITFVFSKDKEISIDERRYLKQLDFLKIENILKGEFASDLEKYSMDQIPLRDNLRKLKSLSNYYFFQKIDNNDIIIQNDYAIKTSKDFNYQAVEKTLEKINSLQKTMFYKNKCYFVLIPEKSSFIEKYTDYSCDFDKVEELTIDNLNKKINYISIKEQLELSDYYYSDSHWKQNKIVDVAATILKYMNCTVAENAYEEKEICEFKGVFSSQAALNLSDKLICLQNQDISSASVFNYETNEYSSVYNLNKLTDEKSLDKYDMFLSGATPLLRINNEYCKDNKELIVFRDSFGSSLIPLFINNYKTIYVVDLRYIDSKLIKNYIDINGDEDVLFMYSTLLLETPNNFKI